VEEHRQLGCGPAAVLLGEAEHRILHEVERRLLVVDCENRLLERPPLDTLQEGRELAS
jgi:hypothetical protein